MTASQERSQDVSVQVINPSPLMLADVTMAKLKSTPQTNMFKSLYFGAFIFQKSLVLTRYMTLLKAGETS